MNGHSTDLQWTLLLNVMFGAIASRAFAEFHQSLAAEADSRSSASTEPRVSTMVRYAVFASVFAFYLYDWIVLQTLYARFPYNVHSFFSFPRFATDIVMAFLLFGIVWNAAGVRVFSRPTIILCRLTLWHVLAATWHLLASFEYHQPPSASTLAWHLVVAPGSYWFIFYGIRAIACPQPHDDQSVRRFNRWVLAAESAVVLTVSVTRTFFVLQTFA